MCIRRGKGVRGLFSKVIDLTKKENWTKELIYVHRTRLTLGFILGIIMGVLLSALFKC